MNSNATPTIMINDVAPIPCNVVIPVILQAKEGINATIAIPKAPINVVLLKILSNASAVGLPGFFWLQIRNN